MSKLYALGKCMVISALTVLALVVMTGCESANERELRLDREHEIKKLREENGSAEASRERSHERNLAYIQRPVAPGSYIDYRGNTDHGYWQNGRWEWNDPQSGYATQSRHYVDYGMATGLLATAVLTQAVFNNSNSSGWQSSNVTVNNYTSTSGKTISKEKYKNSSKSLNKKKKAQDKKRKKLKPKTVSKTTGTKKPDSKWKSKRKAEPTYGKNGFKSKFQSNKQKALNAKNSGKPVITRKTVKSSYKKPKPKKSKKSTKKKSK